MIKNRVSIILPSRNEQFLYKTTKDLLEKAKGDVEIIVVLDGYWEEKDKIIDRDNVIYLHKGTAEGMRAGINSAVAISTGEYLMKLDAHCMVGEGFDEILKADHQPDWVQIPRRKRLDAEKWEIQDVGKPDIDYMYLSFPDDPADFGGAGLNGKVWDEKNNDPKLKDKLLDETMSGQGSCWFMTREYFDWLELMDEENYGTFWNEMQEIGLKCQLSGGKLMRNKKTWYAHLHKGSKYGRGYFLHKNELTKGSTYTKNWLFKKTWHKQKYNLAWLIEKFWTPEHPVPTWSEDRSTWLGNYKID